MTDTLLQGFYLGDLLIQPLAGRISGPGIENHLPPTAAEVLVRLAQEPGQVVERDAIIESVWGEGRGSPEALSHAVSEIRHALDDHATDPHFIQTLPRRGYRLVVDPIPVGPNPATETTTTADEFISQLTLFESLKRRGVLETAVAYVVTGWLIMQVVDVVFDQLLLPQWAGTFVTVLVIAGFPVAVALSWFLEFRGGHAYLDTRPDRATPARRLSRSYLSIVGALLIASVGVFIYDQTVGLPTEETALADAEAIAPEIRGNSIAVLRFFNIDGGETTEIFASGLSDDIINGLASINGLAVSSRGDSWTMDPNSASQDVRRRLGVAYYVEGSVRISDGVLRVLVQLIDSSNGFHLVSRDFEKELEDFLDVQRDVTNLIVANLRVVIPGITEPLLDSSFYGDDVDAWVLFQRGRSVFQDVRTVASIDQAIDYYRQSLEVDPGYTASHAGICSAYSSRYVLGGDAEDIDRAETACAVALESNARLYMVHRALGRLYGNTGNHDAAEAAYRRALEINPQDVPSMTGLAGLYRRNQRFDEAEALLQAAISAQPGNWRTLNEFGGFLFLLGRYDEAVDAYQDVVYFDPTNSEVRGNLGAALTLQGNFERAADMFEQALELGEDGLFMSNLGVLYYYLGRFDDAIEMHEAALQTSANNPFFWTNLADALYFDNRRSAAENAFRRARDVAEAGLRVNSTNWEHLTALAWAQQMLGNSDEAEALIERILAVGAGDPYSYYYKALIELRRGERVEAMRTLAQAVDLGYPTVLLQAEPYLEPVRSDRDFRELVAGEP